MASSDSSTSPHPPIEAPRGPLEQDSTNSKVHHVGQPVILEEYLRTDSQSIDTVFASDGPGSSRIEGTFAFNHHVATVFDDMAIRSIPLYRDLQLLTCDVAAQFALPHTTVYDIGCSTGTSLALMMSRVVDPTVKFVGIDSSESMVEQARTKLRRHHPSRAWTINQASVGAALERNASLVVCHFTLQFTPISGRLDALMRFREALEPEGALLISEKTAPPRDLDPLVTSLYHAFKRRNGYSETEIERKDLALRDVLIPIRREETEALLAEAGYRAVTPLLQGYQFVTWLVFP